MVKIMSLMVITIMAIYNSNKYYDDDNNDSAEFYYDDNDGEGL